MFQIDQKTLSRYLERRLTDYQDSQVALKNKDWSVIENIGHKLKGNGQMFGFPELSEIGRLIESSSQNLNEKDIQSALEKFKIWLNARVI